MSKSIKEMYEDKQELFGEIQNLRKIDEDPDERWSKDHQRQWDELQADFNDLNAKIERAEQMERLNADVKANNEDVRERMEFVKRQTQSPDADVRKRSSRYMRQWDPERFERLNVVVNAWAQRQCGMPVDPEDEAIAHRDGFDLRDGNLDIELAKGEPYGEPGLYRRRRLKVEEMRMVMTTDPTGTPFGGYLIPEGFVREWEFAMLTIGGLRAAARVLRTAEGNDLPWPMTDDTANEAVIIGENTAVGTAPDLVVTRIVLTAHKYTTRHLQISTELLQDSAFDMAAEIGRQLGTRTARGQNNGFTLGDGSGAPLGIKDGLPTGLTRDTSGGETTVDGDSLIRLMHSIDPAYRAMPGAGFMMHDATVAEIRLIRDDSGAGAGTGNYLWQPGLQQGNPDRLLGFPIVINQHMDTPGAGGLFTVGDKPVAFGDWSRYIIREAGGIRLNRLVELYAGDDLEAFVAFHRVDGQPLIAGGSLPQQPLVNMEFVL